MKDNGVYITLNIILDGRDVMRRYDDPDDVGYIEIAVPHGLSLIIRGDKEALVDHVLNRRVSITLDTNEEEES